MHLPKQILSTIIQEEETPDLKESDPYPKKTLTKQDRSLEKMEAVDNDGERPEKQQQDADQINIFDMLK